LFLVCSRWFAAARLARQDRWNTHDLRHAQDLHPLLRANDLLVGDRAFCSWAHLAVLKIKGIYGLFRADLLGFYHVQR